MNSDFVKMCSPEEMEHQFENFKFKGPGLYLTKTTTLLAVPLGVKKFGSKFWKSKSNYYAFYVWDCPFEQTVLSVIGSVPTVSDNRNEIHRRAV